MQEKLDAEKVAARKLKVLSDLCMIIISRQENLGIMRFVYTYRQPLQRKEAKRKRWERRQRKEVKYPTIHGAGSQSFVSC